MNAQLTRDGALDLPILILAERVDGHLVAVEFVEQQREPAARVDVVLGRRGRVLPLEWEEVRLESALDGGEVEVGVVEDSAEERFDDVT